MTQPHLDFIVQSAQAETPQALYDTFRDYVGGLGAEAVSYHVVRDRFVFTRDRNGLVFNTFPDAWMDPYLQDKLYQHDPVLKRAAMSFLPIYWYDVEPEAAATPDAQRVFTLMRELEFTDGLGVPVFGPAGFCAYVALGRFEGRFGLEGAELSGLQYACFNLHLRSLFLTRGTRPRPPALSAREIEVLQWLARGKSNAVIAKILGVSPHTIDTVMRRAFEKLDASNRISAVLKAASVGLIGI